MRPRAATAQLQFLYRFDPGRQRQVEALELAAIGEES